ncbi:21723_t:CDS:10 [Entrophospora sp. SA101]|nr:21723_t:CDS:10 [Entrophospora sp. SA101]
MEGILLIDKPTGLTSHQVVKIIRQRLNIKKVGHAGTLDPLATGLLVIMLGKTTKLIAEIINTFNNHAYYQQPPIYSAIKFQGKKLYEYARRGIKIEVPSRLVIIKKIKLLDYNQTDGIISFMAECSKGTYIRSLVQDIAKKLGTVANVKELRRISSGNFHISQASQLAERLKTYIINERRIPPDLPNDIAADLALNLALPISHQTKRYINIRLPNTYYQGFCQNTYQSQGNNLRPEKKNIHINLEYVSANPTGYLHLAHFRHGFTGNALANVYQFLGYQVTREYYINDRGGQITSLINSIYHFYHHLQGVPLSEIVKVEYAGKSSQEIAQKLVENLYEKNKHRELLKELKEKDLIYTQEKAIFFRSSLGADHHGSIARLKSAWQLLGYKTENLQIILVQIVNLLTKEGEKERFSKRAGNTIELAEALEYMDMNQLKFFLLEKEPNQPLTINTEILKEKQEKTGLYYIQYAHARCQQLGKKSQVKGLDKISLQINLLGEKERKIFNLLIQEDKPELTSQKLLLVKNIQIILRLGLNLLGIEAPESINEIEEVDNKLGETWETEELESRIEVPPKQEDLEQELEKDLQHLEAITKKPREFLIKEALIRYIEDMEDIRDVEKYIKDKKKTKLSIILLTQIGRAIAEKIFNKILNRGEPLTREYQGLYRYREVKGYRPVLVISAKWYNEESERITVLPLTRAFNKEGHPKYVYAGEEPRDTSFFDLSTLIKKL